VKNFTISLYAFHLRHTLTDSPDEVDFQKESLLWENLVKVGENSLPFDGLKNLRSNLVCYQNDEYDSNFDQARPHFWLTNSGTLELGNINTKNLKIKAELQPFLLKDTYAFDLNISPESANTPVDVSQINQFQPSSLLPSKIEASLGQTLWIYGEVDENVNCQKLADEIAEGLLKDTNLKPILLNQGKLFGSLLFEYQADDPNEPYNCTKRCHILILLNNNQAPTLELFGKAYDWIINLLCCYHKIFYIYQQACQRKPEARRIYSKLNRETLNYFNLIAKSDTELDQMKDWLIKIAQDALKYNIYLRDLDAHNTSIRTNIANYRKCLQKITEIGEVPHYWQTFLNRDCKLWQTQIKTDINFLAPGKDLFEQMIDSIRGIVEIKEAKLEEEKIKLDAEKAERDRSLERTIQVATVALGSGAIAAASISAHIDKPFKPLNPKYPVHPMISSMFWSTLGTITLGFLTWLWTKRKFKS